MLDKNKFLDDFVQKIMSHGGQVLTIVSYPKYDVPVNPDALILYGFEDHKYIAFIDSSITRISQFQRYEVLYNMESIQKAFGTFPMIICVQEGAGIRYSSRRFKTIFTDQNLKELDRLLFTF